MERKSDGNGEKSSMKINRNLEIFEDSLFFNDDMSSDNPNIHKSQSCTNYLPNSLKDMVPELVMIPDSSPPQYNIK